MTHKILENAPMRTVIRADLLMKLDILSEEMLDKMKTLEEATVLIILFICSSTAITE